MPENFLAQPAKGDSPRAPAPRRPLIGDKIRENFADGKWYRLSDIAAKLGADEDHTSTTLAGISKNQTYQCRAEKKRVGTHVEWRIFKLDKAVSAKELRQKLEPLIQGLEAEGRKNAATVSIPTVATLAHKLRKLLNEWDE
jgi:hypothetical protein